MTNILITGYPRSGKTTLIINFVKNTKKFLKRGTKVPP